MCGILFQLVRQLRAVNNFLDDSEVEPDDEADDLWRHLKELNKKRGPDDQGEYSERTQYNDLVKFYGAVLHLRGVGITKQPIIDEGGQILLWNGEIFNGIEVADHENDGARLFQCLKVCDEATSQDDSIIKTLTKIEGPFAFIYWQSKRRKLWFSRDRLGRRSLLWNLPISHSRHFTLTSVGFNNPLKESDLQIKSHYFEEVPTDGLFCLNFDDLDPEVTQTGSIKKALVHYPWYSESRTTLNIQNSMKFPFGKINKHLPDPSELPILPFSNESFTTPDISMNMRSAIDRTISELSISIQCRASNIPRSSLVHQARLAILFSGGLDCMCLAALADRYLPPEESIDLLNVGFENPRRIQEQRKSDQKIIDRSFIEKTKSIYDVPDRLTGRNSHQELRKISPNRTWNFVEINVPYEEACLHRSEIMELIAPLDTIMDLSIAMAFWFAARGKGQLESLDIPGSSVNYESKAKVLFVGVGADELLGGYSRHREAYRQGGWEKLMQEVQMDVDRISTRNLGRDDRVISAHGKETRFPYLAENVVGLFCTLPIHLKADLRFPRGIGEKLLLRHVARELGLSDASTLWKRAIQFGARTAKMTSGGSKDKGHMKVVAD
ncbi:hypothetical protein G9A89_013915 [Geosiphon pyriformis]|nr:hypothetical protein G9A89_013915 [Geosiphon pyriformis]